MENMEAQSPPQPHLGPTPTHEATQPPPLTSKASSCSKIMLFTNLVARILTFVFLFPALIILATDSGIYVTDVVGFLQLVHFQDFFAYRYVFSVIVLGVVYSLVQIVFLVYQVIVGRRVGTGKAMLYFDFYADKVMCALLATGAGAGFGMTIDATNAFPGLTDFFNKGVAATSLLLIAYLFTEVSQIISSYPLPKKDC